MIMLYAIGTWDRDWMFPQILQAVATLIISQIYAVLLMDTFVTNRNRDGMSLLMA